MSIQLEVVKFRDLLPISSIPRFVPGFDEPTIEITGTDLSSVDKILVNEIVAPEFIIVNKTTIYVQLPESAQNRLANIELVSGGFTRYGDASKVSYEIGNKTRTVSGVLKLLQLFIKWMLQSPGSDIFNPDRGGGLQELVGRISTTRKMDYILGTITRSIQQTASQIRSAQINLTSLPLDERLLSAEITSLNVLEELMEAQVRVTIVSIAGSEAVAALEL